MPRTSSARQREEAVNLLLEPAQRPTADKAKQRPCMGCGQKFESEGWHHRLCPKCRKRSG